MILALLRRIPMSVWIGLGVAIATMAALWAIDRNGYQRGAAEKQAEFDAYKVQAAAALQREKERQAQVVEKTVVVYRDRVKVIKEKGDEIIAAIPVYVRGDCSLASGWRVFHDAAATGDFPENPERAVAAASPVEDLAAIETVAANYTSCRQTAERLTALQQLVKGLAEGAPP